MALGIVCSLIFAVFLIGRELAGCIKAMPNGCKQQRDAAVVDGLVWGLGTLALGAVAVFAVALGGN